MSVANWDNVLILQTSFLGDTVLTLPLISAVRRNFPVRRLTLMCQPMSRELLQDHPALDAIIIDDKKNQDRGLAGLRQKAAALAADRFTLALTPHKSLRSAMMLYLAGIPMRVGFQQSRGWFLFDRRVGRDETRHDVDRNLSLLEAFGLSQEECRRDIELPLNGETLIQVKAKLRAFGVTGDRPVFGINPGSVWPTKRWSIEGFARLIQLLGDKYHGQILLFGGPDDAEVVNALVDRCHGGLINLAGDISLRELPSAISACRVFITNDSGPMHIAVAQRVPTVALFCATTPSLGFYPYTNRAVVVEKDLSCRPCTTHGGRRCPLGTEECIRAIDPLTVMRAVESLFEIEPSAFDVPLNSYRPQRLCA
ncbi:MAG TPA: lipopolysaccharide heptosyltransferase II [Candidatus Binatus sp.]|nr:lipopolysaccharide heptosyltransferase II [Candidatus Binatus sp.]